MNWQEIVAGVIGTVVLYILNEIRKYLASYHTDNELMKAVIQGVQHAEEQYVAPIKATGVQLTPAQQQQAQAIAIDKARAVAPSNLKDIISAWTAKEAAAVVNEALSRLKH